MQKGFSALSFILIIALICVGIIGGTIYLKQSLTKKENALNEQRSEGPEIEEEQPAKDQVFSNGLLKFAVPDDWVVNQEGDGISLLPKNKNINQIMMEGGYDIQIWNIESSVRKPEDYWSQIVEQGQTRNPNYRQVKYLNFGGIEVLDTRLDAGNYSVIGKLGDRIVEFQLNFYTLSAEGGLKSFQRLSFFLMSY